MENLFIEIEEKVAEATTVEELKEKKKEYMRQHRLVLLYFNDVQEMIEVGEHLQVQEKLPWTS